MRSESVADAKQIGVDAVVTVIRSVGHFFFFMFEEGNKQHLRLFCCFHLTLAWMKLRFSSTFWHVANVTTGVWQTEVLETFEPLSARPACCIRFATAVSVSSVRFLRQRRPNFHIFIFHPRIHQWIFAQLIIWNIIIRKITGTFLNSSKSLALFLASC